MSRTPLALVAVALIGCSAASTSATGDAEPTAFAAVEDRLGSELQATDGFVVRRIVDDELGMAHVHLQHTADGVPVRGSEAIVHLNPDGTVRSITDALQRGVSAPATAALSADDAIDRAARATPGEPSGEPRADLKVVTLEGRHHTVWEVRLSRLTASPPSMPVVWIDADSGAELRRADDVRAGIGASRHSGTVEVDTVEVAGRTFLEDTDRGFALWSMQNAEAREGIRRVYDDTDDVFESATQIDAVDVHFATAQTLDYLSDVFGRHGIDDNGGPGHRDSAAGVPTMTMHVHAPEVNAFWYGGGALFGVGDGVNAGPLTTPDIVAHELAHGVVQYSANLDYDDLESGGLNESYADIVGMLVERHIYGDSPDNWLCGEQTWTPSVPGDAARYMNDPARDGLSQDHYDQMATAFDVHLTSGIGNLAFYLAAEGGTHPRRGGPAVTGMGVDAAAQVWYRALTVYMTSTTDYPAARDALELAAEDLYGASSPELEAVQGAFDLVGVP